MIDSFCVLEEEAETVLYRLADLYLCSELGQ